MMRLIIALLLFSFIAGGFAARGGGRGRGKKIQLSIDFGLKNVGLAGKQRGRLFGSRMPIIIQHRNPASMNYYENKDVSNNI